MEKSSARIAVATKNGLYFISSYAGRRKWETDGPFLEKEDVNKVIMNDRGKMYAATLTEGVFSSGDSGRTWEPSSRGLNVRKVWTLEIDPFDADTIYAGTQYGHIFRSGDSGSTWSEVVGLHSAPGREGWGVDWGWGTTGLTIHTIKADPTMRGRIYTITSGTGTYRTDDSGETWTLIKNGVNLACPVGSQENPYSRKESTPEERLEEHLRDVHSCSHKLALTSEPGTVFQQNHCGVYVSRDYGNQWVDISPGEHMRFGFPIDVVENGGRHVFTVPVPDRDDVCKDHNVCIRGQLSVFRTDDAGSTWVSLFRGLPDGVHTNVLRDSFTHDGMADPGVYFGTTTGEVYCSLDLGENWHEIARGLGRIQGLTAL